MAYLIEESPLVVSPTLAVVLGLKKAHLVQQIQYWTTKSSNIQDGHTWVYNTYDEWLEQLPFYSRAVFSRDILALEGLGVVIATSKYNKMKSDRTKWYRIDYEKLENLVKTTIVSKRDYPSAHNETNDSLKMSHSNHDTNTETNQEITKRANPTDMALETSLKSGKRIKKKLTGNSCESVVLQFSKSKEKDNSNITPRTPTGMGMFWKRVLADTYGIKMGATFSKKELGQCKLLLARIPSDEPCLETTIKNWSSFASYLESEVGVKNTPNTPVLGVLLTYASYIEAWYDNFTTDNFLHSECKDIDNAVPPTTVEYKKTKSMTLEEMEAIDEELNS